MQRLEQHDPRQFEACGSRGESTKLCWCSSRSLGLCIRQWLACRPTLHGSLSSSWSTGLSSVNTIRASTASSMLLTPPTITNSQVVLPVVPGSELTAQPWPVMCHTIPEQTKRIPVSCVDVRHVQVLNCGNMQSSMFPQQYKVPRKGWPDHSCHAYLARCYFLLVQSCKAAVSKSLPMFPNICRIKMFGNLAVATSGNIPGR